jgi:kinetochore protein NDC80
MQHCRDNIAEFLASHRCPHPFGPKYLTSPTTKEFQNMFKFLVTEVLDPGFVWGKSFESDCVQILRDMRYPTPEQVGKTALSAAGAPNTWPPILAMLNWLVELSRVSIRMSAFV